MSSADLRCASAFQTIDPDAMRWRGDWAIIGVYQYGDVVLDGAGTFACSSPSGSVGQQPSLTPTAWTRLGGGSGSATVTLVPAINNTTPFPGGLYSGILAPAQAPGTVIGVPISNVLTLDPTHTYRITVTLIEVSNADANQMTILFYGPSINEVIQYFPNSASNRTPPDLGGGSYSTIFKPVAPPIQLILYNYSEASPTYMRLRDQFYVLEDLGVLL
jgi:hypothetical protein